MLTLDCPFCERENPEDAKFCNACGSPLHLKPCQQCGAVDDVRAQACYKCGAPFPARIPKLRPEVPPDQVSDPNSGRLIELFQDSRDASGDYALRHSGPALRAVAEPGRFAPVAHIGGRRLSEVTLTDTDGYGNEKAFRITHKAALRGFVVVAGVVLASAFLLRDGAGPAERTAAKTNQSSGDVSAPANPGSPSVAGSSPGASPPPPAAVAPKTAALAVSSPQAPPAPDLPPTAATTGSAQSAESPPAAADAGSGKVPSSGRNASAAVESPPAEPADVGQTPPGKPGEATEREVRRGAAKTHRERRGYQRRTPSGSPPLSVVRAPSGTPGPTAPPREPARPSYNCTAAVEALGLCSRNGK